MRWFPVWVRDLVCALAYVSRIWPGVVETAATFFKRRDGGATPDDLKRVLGKVADAPPIQAISCRPIWRIACLA